MPRMGPIQRLHGRVRFLFEYRGERVTQLSASKEGQGEEIERTAIYLKVIAPLNICMHMPDNICQSLLNSE